MDRIAAGTVSRGSCPMGRTGRYPAIAQRQRCGSQFPTYFLSVRRPAGRSVVLCGQQSVVGGRWSVVKGEKIYICFLNVNDGMNFSVGLWGLLIIMIIRVLFVINSIHSKSKSNPNDDDDDDDDYDNDKKKLTICFFFGSG